MPPSASARPRCTSRRLSVSPTLSRPPCEEGGQRPRERAEAGAGALCPGGAGTEGRAVTEPQALSCRFQQQELRSRRACPRAERSARASSECVLLCHLVPSFRSRPRQLRSPDASFRAASRAPSGVTREPVRRVRLAVPPLPPWRGRRGASRPGLPRAGWPCSLAFLHLAQVTLVPPPHGGVKARGWHVDGGVGDRASFVFAGDHWPGPADEHVSSAPSQGFFVSDKKSTCRWVSARTVALTELSQEPERGGAACPACPVALRAPAAPRAGHPGAGPEGSAVGCSSLSRELVLEL